MINSILVVCVGNICRSPTGERLLQQYLPEKIISSAGVGAVVGSCAHKTSVQVAKQHGLSLAGHVARQLTSALCLEHDLILVMEKKHIEQVSRISPLVRGKTMLFGHWLDNLEIADPYGQSQEAYEIAYNLLDSAAKKWQAVLSN